MSLTIQSGGSLTIQGGGGGGGGAGSRQPIDANHVLVYYCDETSGTTIANSVSGGAVPLTMQGSYRLADKGLFAHGTSATLWSAAGSTDGAFATGQSLSLGAAFTLEAVCDGWNNAVMNGGAVFDLTNNARTMLATLGMTTTAIEASVYSQAAGVNTGTYQYTSIAAPSITPRMHLALVRDGAAQRLYLNGGLVASATLSGPSPSAALGTATKVSIANCGPQNQPWKGRVAEVRLSNIARSQSYLLDAAKAAGGL